jgi:hypothetical protein
MHRNAQECTGMHRNAQECTGMHRNAQECTGMHRNAQECTGMRPEYTGRLDWSQAEFENAVYYQL